MIDIDGLMKYYFFRTKLTKVDEIEVNGEIDFKILRTKSENKKKKKEN